MKILRGAVCLGMGWLVAGCGSTTGITTPSAKVTSGGTAAAPSTALPTPTPLAGEPSPLLGALTNFETVSLMYEDGIQTGTITLGPNSPQGTSRFGKAIFGIKGNTLGEIQKDGSWTQLGDPIVGGVTDAIGEQNGESWAWITLGARACTSPDLETLYWANQGGSKNLGTLPKVDGSWRLVSFNKAGILVEADACGIGSAPIEQGLVDPQTGNFVNLSGRLSGCVFGAMSDSGYLVCTAGNPAKVGDAKVVVDKGSQRRESFPIGTTCDTGETDMGVSDSPTISDDGRYVSIGYSCQAPGENGSRDQLYLIDTVSGQRTRVLGGLYLAGIGWLPDDELVATHPPYSGTYVVSSTGVVRVLTANGTVQWSF